MATIESPHTRNKARRLRAFGALSGRGSRTLLSGSTLVGVLLASAIVHAQTDVAPPLPNVLILLDTSGSMERNPDATLPAVPAGTISATAKNRWIQAVEVLAGGIQGYQMLAVDRSSADFKNEYGLGGADPYDATFYLNHYRATSNGCTLGPTAAKTWPNDWNTWGVGDFGWRPLTGSALGVTAVASTTCGPTVIGFDGLGVLDTFRDQARFGLMTFDNDPRKLTGWNGTTHIPLDGMQGQWSYFPKWNSTTSGMVPSYGWPAACTLDTTTPYTAHEFENGARNPSAPPWEGPLIPFANDDSTAELRRVNDRIRYAVMAARPYGATPIGPMLADAQEYLWNDLSGPVSDPNNKCRGNFIILVTDGFPNQDLRPSCENNPDPKAASVYPACDTTTGGGGCCPSKRAVDIAYDLAHPPTGKPAVSTFVVGFALSDDTGAAIDCSTVDPSTAMCSTMAATDPRQPCCTLHQIAYNGGTSKALIASDADTLRAALIAAMSAATKTSSTSRTLPVFTGVASSTSSNNLQYEFRSSFKPNPFGAWMGSLERVRWQCMPVSGTLTPVEQAFDASLGDDFSKNINSSTSRNYFSWDGVVAGRKSTDSIRPNMPSTEIDGVEHTIGTLVEGAGPAFVTAMPAADMNIDATSLATCTGATSIDECKAKYLNYAIAQPQPKITWQSRVGNALGDIYHATPVPVGPPSAFIRDESYTTFRDSHVARPPVLLTATNDGLLHAFRNDTTSLSQNELWAFIPPAVLPSISKEYGGAHALLLDMSPVVRDVAFGTSTIAWGRVKADAIAGTANWRTVAVGGLTTGRGYYALDITDVGNADATKAKPKLLWQLTTLADKSLFGLQPAMPGIGTVYYKDPDASVAVETPVAFLPGGEGTLFDTTGGCARWPRGSGVTLPTGARTSVRCWMGPGNSFSVVRLYDGKVLRRFSNDPAGRIGKPASAETTTSPVPAIISAGRTDLVKNDANEFAGIDSPLTGAVSLYPGAVGAITTRALVGDEDGGLWMLDSTDTDPKKWTFRLFHDAYIAPDDNAMIGQPVSTASLTSVDQAGEITVNYATGDQNNFATTNINHIYSLTEHITGTTTKTAAAVVNWHLRFTGGVTPTGPMSLFANTLYFSTFTPGVDSGTACLKGQGTLWGVDYHDTEPGTGTPGMPRARFQKVSTDASSVTDGTCPDSTSVLNKDARTGYEAFFRCVVLDPGTIVFGAGVTQRPSCVSSSSSLSSDPYTGATTSHSTVGGIVTGDFQLVAQTGPKSTTSTGTTTNTFMRTLVAPMAVTKIDSWASVVE